MVPPAPSSRPTPAVSSVSSNLLERVLGLFVAVPNAVLVAIDAYPLAGSGRDGGERHGKEQRLRQEHRLRERSEGLLVRDELVIADIEEADLLAGDGHLRHDVALALI